MRPGVGVIAGLLAVSGCAAGVPVERQVVVGSSRFAAVQGEAALVVRTVLEPAPGAGRREVVGADCEVVTSLYSARLVTPARLVLPNFGPQSPELSFACRAGAWRGTAREAVYTQWRDYPGGYWGPYGPFGPSPLVWGGWGWYGPGYPVSGYRDVTVVLR